MIDYIFYTITSLGCAFFLYYFLLKKQKTFQFNRLYLLGSVILCLLAPVLEINNFEAIPSITAISLENTEANSFSEEIIQENTQTVKTTSKFKVFDIIWVTYLVITLIFIFRYIKNLIGIIKLSKNQHVKYGKLKLIETKDYKNASSFFNFVFINPENLKDKNYSEHVITHELVHCNELHTLDVMFIELVVCFFWFNPFIWLYRKSIVENHEFIADHYTVLSGINIEAYSQSIINSGQTERRVPLSSGFNFIQIKNRIIMLHQSKSSLLKRVSSISLSLVLCFGVLMLSSYKTLKEPLIVVVDAGHGGQDSGFLNEKDIVLNISNRLAALSDRKIKIIQTRSTDEYIDLKERVAFINKIKPDLFLSLHSNTHKNIEINGIEAYFNKEHKENKNSKTYADILVKKQLENFSYRGIKHAGLYLLKNVASPGVFLELGFISNTNDYKVLTNADKQTEIAASIYKGLLEIRELTK